MSTDAARFAIYFTPSPESELWRRGCAWLGRDADSGAAVDHPVLEDLARDDIAAASAAPRHYGFHATLKPPFRLAAGHTADALYHDLKAFCKVRKPFETPPLDVGCLGDFIALKPRQPSAPLAQLAEDCVRGFDRFRASAPDAELAKRRKAGLTPRQDELLAQWGYPYVFDEFRFHMTLTGRLADGVRAAYESALRGYFAPVCEAPMRVDGIAVFSQSGPDAPFVMRRRFTFNGAALADDRAA